MAVLSSGNSGVKNSHWYTREGEPAHRMAKASGEGDRATTLKDAKRLGYIPSVTTILGDVVAKPALEKWKLDQALTAADKNPRNPDESLEYWIRRVKDASWEQVEDAADLGSAIHKQLEHAFAGEPIDPEYQQYVSPVVKWMEEKGLRVTDRERRIVVPAEGYAGTTDVLFTWGGGGGKGILDYKTKKTKPGEKVEIYPEHRWQLAAYARAVYGIESLDDVLAANIFISTTEPGRMEVIKHDGIRASYESFRSICHVWRTVKGYDPRTA
jgi:hypothetical protein